MKVVVIKSPAFISSVLRVILRIKKRTVNKFLPLPVLNRVTVFFFIIMNKYLGGGMFYI